MQMRLRILEQDNRPGVVGECAVAARLDDGAHQGDERQAAHPSALLDPLEPGPSATANRRLGNIACQPRQRRRLTDHRATGAPR